MQQSRFLLGVHVKSGTWIYQFRVVTLHPTCFLFRGKNIRVNLNFIKEYFHFIIPQGNACLESVGAGFLTVCIYYNIPLYEWSRYIATKIWVQRLLMRSVNLLKRGWRINIRADAVCSGRTAARCLNPGADNVNTKCNFTCCLIWVWNLARGRTSERRLSML
jgi:hypothetical protein